MFYYLSQQLLEWSHGTAWENRLSWLRLFHYITVRSAGAAITALVLSWSFGPGIIRWLKQLKFGQDYKDKAEEAGGLAARVLSKKGTPTMGGIFIVTILFLTTVLWTQLDNKLVLLTLLSVLVLTGLGFYDDYAKIIQQSGGGTPPRVKLLTQFAVSIFIGI
jgi:phospho-N-acetylmuramoyl-pentapeptide-transferase